MAKRKALGRGMGALIPQDFNASPESSTSIFRVPLDQIERNPYQPRLTFDQEALEELAQSIKEHDVIQPITVRKLAPNQYQLISGERRFRASKLAKLKDIPAYIREANDEQMVEMALIENIQRAELNPIEIALSYQRLIDEFELTQEKMSEKVGKGRTTITNYLALLRLIPDVQEELRKGGSFTMGHAKALLGISDKKLQLQVFNEVIDKELSVRKTEQLASMIKRTTQPVKEKAPEKKPKENIHLREVKDKLENKFGSQIKLVQKKDEQGEIVIRYSSFDDLNRILSEMDI
ncbi:MAG: ParB/RepB/Spo0J family partition protein [Bacteroidota bacterium]